MAVMKSEMIGGGIVRRLFRDGDKALHAGHTLSGDEVRSFGNHRILIQGGFIDVWPKAPDVPMGQKYIVGVGKDRFDVIQGTKLNDAPLSRKDAALLADRGEDEAAA